MVAGGSQPTPVSGGVSGQGVGDDRAVLRLGQAVLGVIGEGAVVGHVAVIVIGGRAIGGGGILVQGIGHVAVGGFVQSWARS